MTKKKKNEGEYQKFSNLADELLSVSHDEVKAKLEAEKQGGWPGPAASYPLELGQTPCGG